jgi:hypothetical protein
MKKLALILTLVTSSLAQAVEFGPNFEEIEKQANAEEEQEAAKPIAAIFSQLGKTNLQDKLKDIEKIVSTYARKGEDVIDHRDNTDELYNTVLKVLWRKYKLIPESVIDGEWDRKFEESLTPQNCEQRAVIKAKTWARNYMAKLYVKGINNPNLDPKKLGRQIPDDIELGTRGLFPGDAEFDVYRSMFKSEAWKNLEAIVKRAEQKQEQFVKEFIID